MVAATTRSSFIKVRRARRLSDYLRDDRIRREQLELCRRKFIEAEHNAIEGHSSRA
jgi:hypothetical protein